MVSVQKKRRTRRQPISAEVETGSAGPTLSPQKEYHAQDEVDKVVDRGMWGDGYLAGTRPTQVIITSLYSHVC